MTASGSNALTIDLEAATRHLFEGLNSRRRMELIEHTPFSMIDGVLGDAYTISSIYHYTQDDSWWNLFLKRIQALIDVLRSHRFDAEGLLGGLSGLAYLLHVSKRSDGEFNNAISSLADRITTLAERRMWKVRNSIGVSREDYDFSTGLAGTAHFLFSVGGQGYPIARKICDGFLERARQPFPDSFWTCAGDLGERMIENNPRLSSGMRDLGFAHGISSVITTLKRGFGVFREKEYLDAAEKLCDHFIDDLQRHNNQGISYYEYPFQLDKGKSLSPLSRQAWCYGLPGLQVAIAGIPTLEEKIYSLLDYPDSYLDPVAGDFDGMGLCHGIAGRQYVSDQLSLPASESWLDGMKLHIRGFLGGDPLSTNLSFWEGIGGTLAVMSAYEKEINYAPALGVLGA
ncbi:lanthionine synthetase LanC family protein [Corynebacterium propinquum]|uniref:lanthionine synthetase LanC family protein n=1 Tax=Corynebacterium propinquum TaxID=43769 RepID=UPI00254C2817|nr:lanthionine synthetase LanC family protein [Corynebacterium propinquum]MDK8536656.1 lanthionine synthetase LanC family protein [Corynebacterium propinquum]